MRASPGERGPLETTRPAAQPRAGAGAGRAGRSPDSGWGAGVTWGERGAAEPAAEVLGCGGEVGQAVHGGGWRAWRRGHQHGQVWHLGQVDDAWGWQWGGAAASHRERPAGGAPTPAPEHAPPKRAPPRVPVLGGGSPFLSARPTQAQGLRSDPDSVCSAPTSETPGGAAFPTWTPTGTRASREIFGRMASREPDTPKGPHSDLFLYKLPGPRVQAHAQLTHFLAATHLAGRRRS